MVLQVDLSQEQNSKENLKFTEREKLSKSNIPKASLLKRLKNKFRVWQANFAKMPLSHKIIVSFICIAIAGLASIAVVYSFIIFTSPEHMPLDATFKLLQSQGLDGLLFSQDLPTPPKVKDQENPINGELYTKEEFESLKERKVMGAIVENHVDARPQAGLSSADLVYETLVESGITRYLAIFWGKDAEKIGPIRSLRSYFLDWTSEYDDPPICNIGQAGYEPWEEVIVPEADARSYIRQHNIKSFGWYGRNVTWRDRDKFNSGVSWEHVAYSDTETLWEDAAVLGWTGPSDIESLKFKKDDAKEERALSQEIEIKFMNLSSDQFRVKWVFDKDSNTYKRYLANEPHIDENNSKQIAAKNVIIQHCKYRPTGDRGGRIVFTTIGEGDAEIFRDGELVDGSWKKSSRTSRTKFYDGDGNEVELNRGQIWIEVVPVSGTTDLSDITIK
jgi:hypothetical protein